MVVPIGTSGCTCVCAFWRGGGVPRVWEGGSGAHPFWVGDGGGEFKKAATAGAGLSQPNLTPPPPQSARLVQGTPGGKRTLTAQHCTAPPGSAPPPTLPQGDQPAPCRRQRAIRP